MQPYNTAAVEPPARGSAAQRTLGSSGITISAIGLGAWQLAGSRKFNQFFWRALPDGEANAIVGAALAGGINWFDTAEIYGGGQAEEVLAAALLNNGVAPGQVTVATKWFPLFRTASSLKGTIGERRRRLQPFEIDLHQVHMPVSLSSPEAQMAAMADLREAGLIRAIGVSNFPAAWMGRAHRALNKRGLCLASNQVKYSLLDRRIERNGVLEGARKLGITLIAWSPLEQGILTGRYHRDPGLINSLPVARRRLALAVRRSAPLVTALQQIGTEHGATPAQIALSWLIHYHGEMIVAIPGASRRDQAEQNAAAMRVNLSAEEMRQLDEVSRACS